VLSSPPVLEVVVCHVLPPASFAVVTVVAS
jgi:hypothetical protein